MVSMGEKKHKIMEESESRDKKALKGDIVQKNQLRMSFRGGLCKVS